MDANEQLRLLRLTVKQWRVDEDPGVRNAHAREIVEYFEALDSHLSAGGTPPEAWSEGPDAPELDDQGPRYVLLYLAGNGIYAVVDTERDNLVVAEFAKQPEALRCAYRLNGGDLTAGLPERDDDYTPAAINRTTDQ